MKTNRYNIKYCLILNNLIKTGLNYELPEKYKNWYN